MRYLVAFLFLLTSLCLFAQQDTVRTTAAVLDSITTGHTRKIDSLQLALNKLQQLHIAADTSKALTRLDSTRTALQQALQKAETTTSAATIQRKLDSLSQHAPLRYLDSLNNRIATVQQQINNPLEKTEKAINDKLSFLQKETGSDLLPPSVDLPQAALPEGVNASLPGINANGVDVKDATSSVAEKLNLPETDALKEAGVKLNQVSEVSAKVDDYQKEITNLKESGLRESTELSRLAEERIANVDEVNMLQQQSKQLNMPPGGMQSEEAAKNMLQAQAKEEAIRLAKDHFAGKEEALTAAMKKMSDLKMKYESLDSLNVPKRTPNTMKGKPFRQRIVPGFSLQVQKSQYWLLDFNPSLAYNITGRWSAGLGWNQRVAFAKRMEVIDEEKIYGVRAFTEFRWTGGFSFRAEGERMYGVPVANQAAPKEGKAYAWTWSAFAGVKKEYKISNQIRGTIFLLYLVYDPSDSSPYTSKFNTRIGLEYKFKRKKSRL